MPFKRSGSKFWQITVGGVRGSSKTADEEAAKALEAKLNHELWLSQKMGIKPPTCWKEVVVRFIKENQHQASIETTIYRLRWFDPYLGHIADIREINRDMLDNILTVHRGAKSTPCSANSTANRHMAAVSAVVGAACTKWDLIERKPVFRSYPEPESQSRALEIDEWLTLRKELPLHLLRAGTFALATGLRKEKVLGARKTDVDMRRREMKTNGTDNKLGVVIPLNDTAMRVLEDIFSEPVQHMTHIFTYRGHPIKNYGQAWYKALKRAGLEGFTWHGFRHTFNTWLAREGVSKEMRARLCGWSLDDTADIYTHLNVDHLRPYAIVIDRLLAQVTTQKPGEFATHVATSA